MFPSRTAILSGFSKIFSEKSISFDGTDERIVRLGSCPTGDFTISAWIYNTSGTESDEFDAIYSAATEVWFGMSTEASSFMKLHVGDADGSSNHVQTEAGTITKNEWHHVACTYNDSTKAAVLYIDGASSSLDSSETVGTLNTPLLTSVELGVYSTNHTYNHWNGFMDDIAVFDAVLTALQIKNIYNGGLPSDLRGSTNLISYWLMGDGDTFDLIKDVNAHTQKSLTFDASNDVIVMSDNGAYDFTTNFSVSFWMNNSGDRNSIIVGKYATDLREWSVGTHTSGNTGVRVQFGASGGAFGGSEITDHNNELPATTDTAFGISTGFEITPLSAVASVSVTKSTSIRSTSILPRRSFVEYLKISVSAIIFYSLFKFGILLASSNITKSQPSPISPEGCSALFPHIIDCPPAQLNFRICSLWE